MGTSGFSYPEWRSEPPAGIPRSGPGPPGSFYPAHLAPGGFLGHYAERLAGVEVNGTFRSFPRPELLRRWAANVPAPFRFCLKAHRSLTYAAVGSDPGPAAADFGRAAAALGERAGPVLLQLPPTRQRDAGFLARLLEALDRPGAVEPRHPSWFDPAVYRLIGDHGGALVVTDHEHWPMAPRLDLSPIAYLRLRRDYDEAGLRGWAATVRSLLAGHREVHAYFKHGPRAPFSAIRLQELVEG